MKRPLSSVKFNTAESKTQSGKIPLTLIKTWPLLLQMTLLISERMLFRANPQA